MKVLHNHVVRYQHHGQSVLGLVIAQVLNELELKVMNADDLCLDKVQHVDVKEVESVENGRILTTQEFIDEFSNRMGAYDELIQEIKITQEGNPSERLFVFTIHEAEKMGVYLSDLDDFDYDPFFHEMYKDYRL